jgi:prepilin-type processing-associated H-X9-DG protein
LSLPEAIEAYLCLMTCTVEIWWSSAAGKNGTKEDLRATNIACVSDSVDWSCDGLWPKLLKFADGMFGNQQGCRIAEVSDGTSNTLMLGEVTNDIPENYSGFFWAAGAEADTREGINGPHTLPGLGSFAQTTGTAIWGMRLAGFSSWHPGGCHFVMGDGSVRFISQNIPSVVMAQLTTRAGGEAVAAETY